MNKLDILIHKGHLPAYHHRQIEHDFSNYKCILARVSKIAAPFFLLYNPIRRKCSILLGSIRVLNDSSVVAHSICQGKFDIQLLKSALQTSLCIVVLIGMIYDFRLGLYCTAVVDIYTNILDLISENRIALERFEIFLQMVHSLFYLAILVKGSLELTLISMAIQVCMQCIQVCCEYKEERYPEALSKALLTLLKLNQARNQYELIKKRNLLFQLQKYLHFRKRLSNFRNIDDLYNHPFVVLANVMNEKSVKLADADGNVFDFGSHFHGFGKRLVKGMNVRLSKLSNGRVQLDFKVNYVFRKKISKLLDEISQYSAQDIRDLFKIFNLPVYDIRVFKETHPLFKEGSSVKNIVLDIQGLGTISIGESSECIASYNQVTVQMEKGRNVYDLHGLLSFLDLSDALRASASEDIERMKVGQVFRMCCPREATFFERSEEFFQGSVEDLKGKIIKLVPQMQNQFQKYLPKLVLREVIPGRLRYAVEGLSEELYDKGARGLTSTVTGASSIEDTMRQTASILKMGSMSFEMRRDGAIGVFGMSNESNFFLASSDSVFTQLMTEGNTNFSKYWYLGDVRFVYSLKALETISYQYPGDNLGNRSLKTPSHQDSVMSNGKRPTYFIQPYLTRPDIFQFVEKQMQKFSGGNEVMIKDRIPPEYIENIIVNSNEFKQKLIKYLDSINFVQMNEKGEKTIFGKALERFIRVEH